jgi:hypothetical protein
VVPAQSILIPTPAVGDVVSFSYEGNARREMPVSPKIYRIRTDLSWDDVVHNVVKDNEKYLGGMRENVKARTRRRMGEEREARIKGTVVS